MGVKILGYFTIYRKKKIIKILVLFFITVCVSDNKSGGRCSLHWFLFTYSGQLIFLCALPEKSAFIFNYIKQGT